MTPDSIKLTQYSHGAGCGCKIAPKVLDEILKSSIALPDNKNLLVGNHSKDDAAVYDLGNGMALISTTDFFMPVVDDAFDFGRIAAANSISDVYAMGGKPLMAIAILGWPVEKLPVELAQKVIEGGRSICAEAGIPLAGGHSIDSQEPIFGLAVTGIVPIENLKKTMLESSCEYFRILVLSDGELCDQVETINAVSKLKDYLKNKKINSQAVRLFTSSTQPDTRGMASIIQLVYHI